jgi:hypothetical protein
VCVCVCVCVCVFRSLPYFFTLYTNVFKERSILETNIIIYAH